MRIRDNYSNFGFLTYPLDMLNHQLNYQQREYVFVIFHYAQRLIVRMIAALGNNAPKFIRDIHATDHVSQVS